MLFFFVFSKLNRQIFNNFAVQQHKVSTLRTINARITRLENYSKTVFHRIDRDLFKNMLVFLIHCMIRILNELKIDVWY